MLKKVLLISFLFVFGIGIVILISYSNKKEIKDDYYTILENKSYVMKENRDIYFTIYSKKSDSLITYENENKYYLILDDITYMLSNVRIEIFDLDTIYLYKISADMPIFNHDISSNMYLKIENPKFHLTLNFGTISLLNPINYKLISLDSLYASYSYINGTKMLCGLNITFSNEYKYLDELYIGSFNKGYLSKLIYDKKLDNEINIYEYISGYSYNSIIDHQVGLKSKEVFIPITSKNNYITKEGYIIFILDKVKYYLDTFDFMVGELDINKYNDLLQKGVIYYV